MTGEIVNLRRARKARAKAAQNQLAATNRATFGRPRADKTLADATNRLVDARLSGHRRAEPDEP